MEQKKTNETNEQLFTKAQLDEQLVKQKNEFEKKLAEAEKLAKMNAEEKSDFRRKQTEKALAERERAVEKRELAADAAEKLAKLGLPARLVACVNLSSAEECEASIGAVKACFTQAVLDGVNERMRGNVPKCSGSGGADAFLEGLNA